MPSLVDYLQGGLKLHFSVAIDLTKSNGNPSDPLSLHYRESIFSTNRYIRALTAIANVLRVYIPTNDYFAAFGFGAELPGSPGMTSSCFPLGLTDNPHCIGVEGILEAYTNALSQVTLSGPTNFAPLIDTVSKMAAQRPNTQSDQNVSFSFKFVLTSASFVLVSLLLTFEYMTCCFLILVRCSTYSHRWCRI